MGHTRHSYSSSPRRPAARGTAAEGRAHMPAQRIPAAIKARVQDRIAAFNHAVLREAHVSYQPRYRGAFLYLDRGADGQVSPICRLRYTGTLDRWVFAIYPYSDERCDPDEWIFCGAAQVDGTLEGAMRAGLVAYPP